jgi:hypothetical protein
VALFRRKHTTDAKGMRAHAATLGLEYDDAPTPEALIASGHLPEVPLLRDLDPHDISQLLSGEVGGLDVRIFRYAPTSYNAQGSTPRTCALLGFEDVVLPDIFISPRERLPRLGEKLRDGGVAVGSPELMTKFSIQARSREHATDVIGNELDAWLSGCSLADMRIEIRGGSILAHIPEVGSTAEITDLLEFVRGFHQRISERTWQLYRKL